jgi:hypothetical protein
MADWQVAIQTMKFREMNVQIGGLWHVAPLTNPGEGL